MKRIRYCIIYHFTLKHVGTTPPSSNTHPPSWCSLWKCRSIFCSLDIYLNVQTFHLIKHCFFCFRLFLFRTYFMMDCRDCIGNLRLIFSSFSLSGVYCSYLVLLRWQIMQPGWLDDRADTHKNVLVGADLRFICIMDCNFGQCDRQGG